MMNFDVRSLASLKHLETKHDEIDWIKALESARQSLKFIDINFQSLEHIALASRTPTKFTTMTRLIYQYGKSYPNGDQISDLLLEYTNDSPFSLSDWVDSIDYFYQWLTAQGRKIDFLPMLKYLGCCVASPDAKEGGQTFSELLEDMLKVNGYDG
jgi:hypothetical protein